MFLSFCANLPGKALLVYLGKGYAIIMSAHVFIPIYTIFIPLQRGLLQLENMFYQCYAYLRTEVRKKKKPNNHDGFSLEPLTEYTLHVTVKR